MNEPTSRAPWWGDYARRVYGLRFLTLLLLLIQLFPAVDYYVRSLRAPYLGELVYQGISLLSWSVLPSLLLALLPWRWLRGVLQGATIVLYALLCLFESFLVYSYSSLYTDSIALNILATNPEEASSFLEHLNGHVFLLPLLVLLVLFVGYLCLARRQAGGSPRQAQVLVSCSLLLVGLSVFVAHPAQRQTHSYLYMAPLERVYVGTTTCLRDAQELAAYTERVRQTDLGQVRQVKSLEGVNVVVVIGESMRRDYMHCYGYPLPNTPAQDSLIARGDLVPFTDVISSASWTTGSVSQSMSFYRQGGEAKEWYQYPSLPYVMSRAGYFSLWLSNQEKQGAGLQPIATLATTADSALFAKNRATGDWNSAADLELIPLLPKLGQLPAGKHALFQVVHLMGSHTPYHARSSAPYAPFTTEDLPERLPYGLPTPQDKKRRENLRDYVNSIRYNDEVLRRIIDHFADTPTLLVYFSDHGQALYENPERPDYYEHEVSLPGVAIPFLVYLSPSLRASHPELYAEVERARGRRIMNDLFANSLCGLLGIELKQYESRYDFFAPDYDEARKRVLAGYDGQPLEL